MPMYDDEGRLLVSLARVDRIIDADGDTYVHVAEDYIDFYVSGAQFGRIDANGLCLAEYLRHCGDLDTYLRFRDNRVGVVVGNVDILDIVPGAAVWNEGGADVDFRWEGVGAPNALFIQGSDGKIGIGTNIVPHGGVGYALLALEGPNANANGPHVQFTTAIDDYPILQFRVWAHDYVVLYFDSYYDGADRSSDIGSNYSWLKNGDLFYIRYKSGIAQGNPIAWNIGLVLDPQGNIGIGTASHGVGAQRVLHFVNTAMDPGTSVDVMHIYCKDRSPANAQFCCYQESAILVEVDEGKMSHKWPVRLNGVDYFIMLCQT